MATHGRATLRLPSTVQTHPGWVTREELEQMAEALIAWGAHPDAFYARPSLTAIGWA